MMSIKKLTAFILCSIAMNAFAAEDSIPEVREPLRPRSAESPAPSPPVLALDGNHPIACWNNGLSCLPNWYHPCYGPIVTNIKLFNMDPFWLDKKPPIYQELYREFEKFPMGIIRDLRKKIVIKRNYKGIDQTFDPCGYWTNCCLTIPGSILINLGAIGPSFSLIGSGVSLACFGVCGIPLWCCVASQARHFSVGGILEHPE